MQVCPDGSVVVRSPLRTSRREIERVLSIHMDWILRTQKRMQARRLRDEAQRQAYASADAAGQKAPDGWSWILTPPEIASLKQQASPVFAERTARYAPLVGPRGVTWNRITIRCQKTRWGSCSSRGNLSFNCLLLLAPPAVLDYVVVHELCHRLHMDHSPAFWQEVERVLPDCRDCERWLKKNGRDLMKRAGH